MNDRLSLSCTNYEMRASVYSNLGGIMEELRQETHTDVVNRACLGGHQPTLCLR